MVFLKPSSEVSAVTNSIAMIEVIVDVSSVATSKADITCIDSGLYVRAPSTTGVTGAGWFAVTPWAPASTIDTLNSVETCIAVRRAPTIIGFNVRGNIIVLIVPTTLAPRFNACSSKLRGIFCSEAAKGLEA
jgi:hypothetical protein